jgi:hypothetical protein
VSSSGWILTCDFTNATTAFDGRPAVGELALGDLPDALIEVEVGRVGGERLHVGPPLGR